MDTWLDTQTPRTINKIAIQQRELLEIEKEMLDTILEVDTYCYNKGRMGGLDWGFKSFNKAFEGLQPGLILFAGGPNTGKTAMCMQLAWQIAQANKEVAPERPNTAYVMYFSLDDNAREVLPRIIAIDQKVPINVVKAPKKYEEDLVAMAKRANGLDRLKKSIDRFKIKDSIEGTSIEWIEQEIRRHYIQIQETHPEAKLVVFIDNFHDITVDSINFKDNDNAKFDHLADALSGICTQLDIPIMCTAEFRKLNGMRRPTVDDIRSAAKIGYEAKAIILCYNEVGLRGDSANIYWLNGEESTKKPVFEAHIGKNKYSSFKGRVFFDFRPEMAHMTEADEEDTKRYSQMIHG